MKMTINQTIAVLEGIGSGKQIEIYTMIEKEWRWMDVALRFQTSGILRFISEGREFRVKKD